MRWLSAQVGEGRLIVGLEFAAIEHRFYLFVDFVAVSVVGEPDLSLQGTRLTRLWCTNLGLRRELFGVLGVH
jgi:hypothetical protein